jgi:hypothetical protein
MVNIITTRLKGLIVFVCSKIYAADLSSSLQLFSFVILFIFLNLKSMHFLRKVAGDGSGVSLFSKLSVITLCSEILFPMQKQCYVALSTIIKPAEIQLALILVW